MKIVAVVINSLSAVGVAYGLMQFLSSHSGFDNSKESILDLITFLSTGIGLLTSVLVIAISLFKSIKRFRKAVIVVAMFALIGSSFCLIDSIIYEEANSIIVSIEQRFLRVVVMLVIPGFNIWYVFQKQFENKQHSSI